MENFILYSFAVVAAGVLILLLIYDGKSFKNITLKLCHKLNWRHHVDKEPLRGLHEPTPETFYQGPPAGGCPLVQLICPKGHTFMKEEIAPGMFRGCCPTCGSISFKPVPAEDPPSVEEIGGEYPEIKASGRGKMVCYISDKWATDADKMQSIKGFVSLTASGVLMVELNDYYDIETLKHTFGNIEFSAISYKKPGELAPAHEWLVKSFLIVNWVIEPPPAVAK